MTNELRAILEDALKAYRKAYNEGHTLSRLIHSSLDQGICKYIRSRVGFNSPEESEFKAMLRPYEGSPAYICLTPMSTRYERGLLLHIQCIKPRIVYLKKILSKKV